MFTDFKDFSKISSTLTSAELVENLDVCFKEFDEIIAKYNLEKIKTIGDAYMCAGGISAEESSENHFVSISQAAIEIRDFVKKWNQEKLLKGEVPWEIRIGIHSGPLTAGVVGKKKFAFDIWGDTVNIASRMESACEPGKVNVSKDTWNLIHDQFNGTYRGKVKVKNIGEIEMFYVNSFGLISEN
jgi:class 3 adenylate cyclase